MIPGILVKETSSILVSSPDSLSLDCVAGGRGGGGEGGLLTPFLLFSSEDWGMFQYRG